MQWCQRLDADYGVDPLNTRQRTKGNSQTLREAERSSPGKRAVIDLSYTR